MNDVSAEKTFSVLCALCGYVRLCGLCGQYAGAWATWLLVANLSTAIVVAHPSAVARGALSEVEGQQPPASTPPKTPRAAAPVDLTGYWVSVITEDWRFRMVTPPKGDTASLPLNDAGTAAAKQWDPAKDIAAGEPCRAFGAAGIMRLPIRLRVTWQDDTTMRVDIDNGQQTRVFRFDRSTKPPAQPQWQGHSLAEWETVAQGQGVFGAGGNQLGAADAARLSGSLKVITTRMRPGYLRRNGIPYSGAAMLTEFFDRTDEPSGDSWLILTSIVEDPTYLNMPLMLSTHFKREPDGAKFNPRACEVTAPVVGTGQ
jgi:hypothetical protein